MEPSPSGAAPITPGASHDPNTLPVMLWEATAQGVITYVNAATERFLGLGTANVLGMNVESFTHPQDRTRVRRAWTLAQRDRELSVQVRLPRSDGAWRWVRLEARPVTPDHASTWVGTVSDVHAQRLTREREVRFETFVSELASARTVEEVLNCTLEAGRRAVRAAGGALALLSQDGSELRVVQVSGVPGLLGQREVTSAGSPAADVVLAAQARFLSQLDVQLAYPAHAERLAADVRALVVLPLSAGGRVLGTLELHFSDNVTFERTERAHLQRFARQSGLALQRALEQDAERRSLQQLAFLAETSRRLGASLDLDRTLQEVAGAAVPQLADWCAVYVPNGQGVLEPLTVAHVEPGKVEVLRRLLDTQPIRVDGPGGTAQVFRTGEPLLVPNVTEAMVRDAAPDESQRAAIRALDLYSVIAVPLTAHGERIGVLSFASSSPARTFSEQDLLFAQDVASRAAQAVENARLHRRAQESERRYRTLLELLPQIVWTVRPDGTVEQFSGQWSTFTGLPETATHEDWLSAIHSEDREQALAARRIGLQAGRRFEYEMRLRNHAGEYRWLLVQVSPTREDGTGEVLGWVSAATDITERKRMEQRMQSLNARLEQRVRLRTEELEHLSAFNRLLLDSVGEGILGIDRAGLTTFANPAALAITGYSERELLGRHQHVLLHHSHVDGEPYAHEDCPILQSASLGIERRVTDEVFWRKDGSSFPVEYVATPLRGSDGAAHGAVVTFRDVTERRRAEQELRDANEELRRSNADLEQFAYVASHDLQEPLRTVASFTELLARRYRGQLDDNADVFIDMIVQGAGRMKRLVDDLLTYSRLRSYANMVERVPVAEVLQGVLRDLDGRIREAGAIVTYDALPDLQADPALMRQVLSNLIGNALKFTRPDVPPRLHVGAVQEDGGWRLSVSDNGIGIEEQYFDRIFSIFQRLHGRDQYDGNGMGLAICKSIVERQGGRLGVESRVGEGSTFWFTLPD